MTQVDSTPTGRYHVWTLGDRLRIARESVTPSQGAFGALIGMSRNTVNRYENNATEHVKRIYIERWAERTGYSYHWLMTGEIPVSGDITGRNLRRHARRTAKVQVRRHDVAAAA